MPLGMNKNSLVNTSGKKKLKVAPPSVYVAVGAVNGQFQDSAILPSYQFMIYRIDEATKEWEYFIRCEEDQFTQGCYDILSRNQELYVCGAFSKIGTQTISRIARYEGDFQNWSNVE